ncbi:hypothetical protein M2163_002560 [Streptomyces sp. SAI-135]|nr:hypothetical protein [Streptomyces sp. SAI-090]MDH6615452.1 hypothetical protein [Streptomyces sp. SAI-135]
MCGPRREAGAVHVFPTVADPVRAGTGPRALPAAGASWSQIGAALGTSAQAAGEAHTPGIDGLAAAHGKPGRTGFDEADAAEARAVAGEPEDR